MAESRACKRCAAALTPGGSLQGICPRCLMELGIGDQDIVYTRAGAAEAALPDPEQLAEHLPLYEILEILGRGGMGVVYKARQKSLDRLVALKVLTPRSIRNPAFSERFTREAQALASLGHPGIVSVFDFGLAGNDPYLAMEYVDGLNLRELSQREKISPRQALSLVSQISDALQYAHDHGVVHRDIKPENVLVDRQGKVKITDFGLAKLLEPTLPEQTLTSVGQVMGTPHYMAPEQVEHPLEVDHRADIYSLGVVFYELLTGELPLGRFTPPSQKVQIDVRLDDVVLKALEKEPSLRYQHASEVKTDVERITAHGASRLAPVHAAAHSAHAGHAVAGGKRFPGYMAIFMVGLLVVLLVIGLLLIAPFRERPDMTPIVEETSSKDTGIERPPISQSENPSVWMARGLGISSAQQPLLAQILSSIGERYLALEQAHTRGFLGERDHLILTIDAFEEERSAIAASLWEEIGSAFGASVGDSHRYRVLKELMPFGTKSVTLELWHDATGYHVEDRTVNGSRLRVPTSSEPQRDYSRFWGMLADRPLSAQAGLSLIMESLADFKSENQEGRIVLQSINSTYHGRRGSREAFVEVGLKLSFLARDAVAASMLFEGFKRKVRGAPWCDAFENRTTGEIVDPPGIVVNDLSITVRPEQSSRLILLNDGASIEPTVYIRSIMQEPELDIGPVAISNNTKNFRSDLGNGVKQENYHFRTTDRERAFKLETLVVMASTLEQRSELVTVTEVQLNPLVTLEPHEEVGERWSFRGTISIVSKAD